MNKNKSLFFLFFLIIVTCPVEAGQVGDVIASFQSSFEELTGKWIEPLQSVSKWLLLTLALISLAWSGIQNVLRTPDLGGFLVDVIRMVMVVGFFLYLINDAKNILQFFINGWILVANKANGGVVPLNSISAIFDNGLIIGYEIYAKSSGLAASIVAGILSIVVVLFYAAFAMFAMAAYLEAYIVTAASIILLGFGSSQWTNDYARAYFRFLMATGLKFYVLFLMLGFIDKLVTDWSAKMNYAATGDVLSLMGLLAIGVYLVAKIPTVAAGMITGASLGQVAPTGGQMMSAAVGTATGAIAGGMAVSQAIQLGGKQAGGSEGGSYKAANALGNLAGAAKDVAVGRIMGDPKASQGSFTGQMAQSITAKNSGLGVGERPDTRPDIPKDEVGALASAATSTGIGGGGSLSGSPTNTGAIGATATAAKGVVASGASSSSSSGVASPSTNSPSSPNNATSGTGTGTGNGTSSKSAVTSEKPTADTENDGGGVPVPASNAPAAPAPQNTKNTPSGMDSNEPPSWTQEDIPVGNYSKGATEQPDRWDEPPQWTQEDIAMDDHPKNKNNKKQ